MENTGRHRREQAQVKHTGIDRYATPHTSVASVMGKPRATSGGVMCTRGGFNNFAKATFTSTFQNRVIRRAADLPEPQVLTVGL